MLFVREYVEYKPWGACRILVVVDDKGRCQVEEYLKGCKATREIEYKKMRLVLAKAASLGPRGIHDDRLCKIVGNVGEFKALGKLLRVFWFFADSKTMGNRRIDTIVLTHAARPGKGQEQDRAIKRAEDIHAQYQQSPFPWYKNT